MTRATLTRSMTWLPLLLTLGTAAGRAQSPFKASLTATVIIQSAGGPRKDEQASEGRAAPALGCRAVTLRWNELAGARRYVVYVSSRTDGPWSALPPSNVCGHAMWRGATLVTDVEPSAGAPSVSRRLYYKVFALASSAPDAPTLAVTDAVMVELP